MNFYKLLNDDLVNVNGGSIVGNVAGDLFYYGQMAHLKSNKMLAKRHHIHIGY